MRIVIEEKKLRQYVENNYSTQRISVLEKVSQSTVKRWMSLYHIKGRKVSRPSNKKDYEHLRVELENYLSAGESTRKIGERLKISQVQVSRIIRRLGLESTCRPGPAGPGIKMRRRQEAFKKGSAYHCIWCGRLLDRCKMFCDNKCNGVYKTFEARFCKDSKTTRSIRRYLLYTRGHKCESCGRIKWNDLPIPLEVDHIDGHHENAEEDNIRLLCPNCHAQTPTYKGRNKGNGRDQRMKRYKEGKTF